MPTKIADARPQVVTYRLVRADTAAVPFNILPHANSQPQASRVTIQPLFSNTGDVYVGSAVVNTTGPLQGYVLPSPVSYGAIPQELLFDYAPVDLAQIYVLPQNNSEGVVVLLESMQM